jgi:hypothetical protein
LCNLELARKAVLVELRPLYRIVRLARDVEITRAEGSADREGCAGFAVAIQVLACPGHVPGRDLRRTIVCHVDHHCRGGHVRHTGGRKGDGHILDRLGLDPTEVLAQLDVVALALYFGKQEVLGFDGHVTVQRHVAFSVQDLMAGPHLDR